MKTPILGLLVLLGAASTAQGKEAPALSPATTAAQANLVDIRSLVPDIHEDIKYAGHDNFVGRPVEGYEAPTCLLLKPAAARLMPNLR